MNRATQALLALTLAAFVAVVAACSSNRNNGLVPTRKATVDIFQDHITPKQLTLSTGTIERLQIQNHTKSGCVFSVGSYVNNEQVPAGETATVFFTVSTPSGNPTSVQATGRMGCSGAPQQQAAVLIETKGVRPGQ